MPDERLEQARTVARELCHSGAEITADTVAEATGWTREVALRMLISLQSEGTLERKHGVGIGPNAIYIWRGID